MDSRTLFMIIFIILTPIIFLLLKYMIKFYLTLQAALKGNIDIQFLLGTLLIESFPIKYFEPFGIKWLVKSAEGGHIDALCKLGLFYIHGGSYIMENHHNAELWLKKAAEGGDMNAAFNLGNLYALDVSSVHDYQKSVFWLQKAACSGYPEAQFMLALMYRDGVGVEMDYIQSLKWFILAAENGKSINDMEELKIEMSLESIEKARQLARYAKKM